MRSGRAQALPSQCADPPLGGDGARIGEDLHDEVQIVVAQALVRCVGGDRALLVVDPVQPAQIALEASAGGDVRGVAFVLSGPAPRLGDTSLQFLQSVVPFTCIGWIDVHRRDPASGSGVGARARQDLGDLDFRDLLVRIGGDGCRDGDPRGLHPSRGQDPDDPLGPALGLIGSHAHIVDRESGARLGLESHGIDAERVGEPVAAGRDRPRGEHLRVVSRSQRLRDSLHLYAGRQLLDLDLGADRSPHGGRA